MALEACDFGDSKERVEPTLSDIGIIDIVNRSRSLFQ